MKITIHMATNVIIGDNIKLHCSPRPSSVSGGSTKTLTHYDQILKEADDELEFMEMFKRNVPGTIEKSIDDISEPIATSSDSNLEPTATAENSNLEPMETASNSNIEPMATVSKSNLEPTATASNSNLEPMAKSKNNIPEPKASTVKNIPEPMATSRNNISEYFLEDIEVDIGGSVSGSNVDGGSASRGAVSGGSVNRNSDASIGNNAGTKPKKTFGSTWSPLDLRATDSASARSGSLPGRSSANKSRNTLSRELEKTADASESASLTTIERKESRSEEASTTENEKVDETSTDINVSM